MDFITGLNRLLRTERIIKGDDDDITTFDDTQHQADIELAQIAIQNELVACVADRLIGYEEATATITSVASTTTYALATDFVRFAGKQPMLYDTTNNRQIFEYRGGKDALELDIPNYASQTGDPFAFYFEPDSTKKISLYHTPDSTNAGKVYTYRYEKDVSVTTSTATIPFVNDIEAWQFITAASRRFRFMREKLDPGNLDQDPIWVDSRATLAKLLRHKNPVKLYGKRYS